MLAPFAGWAALCRRARALIWLITTSLVLYTVVMVGALIKIVPIGQVAVIILTIQTTVVLSLLPLRWLGYRVRFRDGAPTSSTVVVNDAQ